MVFLFKRFAGILNLITQLLVCAIWIAWCTALVRGLMEGIREDHANGKAASASGVALLSIIGAWMLAGAGGSLFWFWRQFQHASANRRLIRFLEMNAEKIRNNEPVYYRCKRITAKTVLVRHHLVCSAVILTGRMSTRWLIKGQEPRLLHALGASLYSFWNGWWAFPFGLIWTPMSIIRNMAGDTMVLVEDLIRVAPPPPTGFQQKVVAGMKSDLKDLLFVS